MNKYRGCRKTARACAKVTGFCNRLYKLPLFYLLILSFIGCNSLPKNITRKEYDSVRDYVSMNIAGMDYSELLFRLNQQRPPQYYPDGGLFDLPHYKEKPGSNFSKYNNYLIEISNKMNQLVDSYRRTDQVESFYSWAITSATGS